MNINQIAEKLNSKAVREGFEIAKLPELRKQFLHKKKLPINIFTHHTIFSDYAFHHGGRDEMQFNVGEDWIGEKSVTRYALCFSLESSPSLTNPVDTLAPFKGRFNALIESHPEFFNGFEMWYYQDQKRYGNYSAQKIPENWFLPNTFIAIGNIIDKPLSSLTEEDLSIVLSGFDNLLPIYKFCVLQSPFVLSKGKRIARLCWNDNGWVMPSGRYGKSKQVDSHEAKAGYGHEEWLFDLGKIIDGYHYGFLEPIRKKQDAFAKNVYDVWLYTIDGETKKRYWVGEIKNLEVIDKAEANKIKDEYIKRNWLKEMEEQIKASGSNAEGFSNWNGVDLFNVRFLPSNKKLNDPYFELPKNHPIYKQKRYVFAFFKDKFNVTETEEEHEFSFISTTDTQEDDDRSPNIITHAREPKAVEITYLHKAISKSLTKNLREKYGEKNVTPEHPAGYGANKIDLVVNDNNDLLFYEIKTYPTLRTSIREAIGQLMEYALWTNKKRAKQLIVVTQTQPQEDFEKANTYFKHLRDTYNLPIYYQSYDYKNNILSDKV